MKKILFVLLILSVSTLGLFAQKSTKSVTKTRKAKFVKTAAPVKQNVLLPMLPESDSVISLDVQRLLGSLPIIFADDAARIAQINSAIEKIKAKTGIDVRSFENVGAGLRFVNAPNGNINVDSTALVRGKFNPSALLAVAKVAAKGNYREEKIGERTVYVFNMKAILEDVNATKIKGKNSMADQAIDWLLQQFSTEIGATAYDDQTLAIGSIGMLKDFLGDKKRVSSELLSMANVRPNAVMSFAGAVPDGIGRMLGLDNDEIGKLINSLRQMYGSLDVTENNASIQIIAKTETEANAKDLSDTLEGLQMLGSGIVGANKKDPNSKIYSKMIDNLKISRKLNEVKLELDVAHTDIRTLAKKL